MFNMLITTVKNLFKAPATRKYPFIKREPFKGARGSIEINIDDCIHCGICSKQCPANAILVNKDEKSWSINRYKCIMCEYCTEKCPKKCLSVGSKYAESSHKKDVFRTVREEKDDN